MPSRPMRARPAGVSTVVKVGVATIAIVAAAAVDRKGDRLTRPQADEHGDVFKGCDRAPVHALDQVSRPEAGRVGRAAGDDAADARRDDRLADEIGEGREGDYRRDEIRGGARGHDRGARRQRLGGEARWFAIRHSAGLTAHGNLIAGEANVAADRYGREPPSRAASVGKAEQLRPEPDRKDLGLHAEPTPDDQVPEFMHERDDADNERRKAR